MKLAASRDRRFGCKFSNTLEVLNHRTFFTPDNKVQYLSGQPLYVITLTLTDVFRQAVGPHVPISYSAGIDQGNFAARRRLRLRAGHGQQRSLAPRRLRPHLDVSEGARSSDAEGRRQKRQRLHLESLRPGRRRLRQSRQRSHRQIARIRGPLGQPAQHHHRRRKSPQGSALPRRQEPQRADAHRFAPGHVRLHHLRQVPAGLPQRRQLHLSHADRGVRLSRSRRRPDGAVARRLDQAFRDHRKNADRLLLRFLQRVRQLRHVLSRVRRPVHQKAHLLRQRENLERSRPARRLFPRSATKTPPASTAA